MEDDQGFSVFKQMEQYGHEQVIFNYDKSTGLKAIISIHDTTLGPAVGGCRMWPYESEQDAIEDALRLSRAMTYKCAMAGVQCGGGKTVIIGDGRKDKSDELFQALGTFVDILGGRFWTGTDVGTTGIDFVSAAKQTRFVNGLPEAYGGSGNSAVITAYGVYWAMKATLLERFSGDSLKGRSVAVQGLGKVGGELVSNLLAEGARVYAADVSDENVQSIQYKYPQVEIVSESEIFEVECDIFSPNALGGGLNHNTVLQLKAKTVCGAANNQLADSRVGDELHSLGILYAPDYVVNAGGLIGVADEFHGFNKERAFAKAESIYNTLLHIFRVAREQNLPPYKIADIMAEARIEKIGGLQSKCRGGASLPRQ